jgi:hypothetical protein
MRSRATSLTQTDVLIRALFSLEEPWRSRFLDLVANLATNSTWDGRPPTREEVTAWLSADLDLYREVKLLLDAWLRPKPAGSQDPNTPHFPAGPGEPCAAGS